MHAAPAGVEGGGRGGFVRVGGVFARAVPVEALVDGAGGEGLGFGGEVTRFKDAGGGFRWSFGF